MKLGLKLGTQGTVYIDAAQELRKKGHYDFLELFIVPGSDVSQAEKWRSLDVPFVLHAPHSMAGMNPSLLEMEEGNRKCIAEVAAWVRALKPGNVIYHAGAKGTLSETLRQFKSFKQTYPDAFKNALIENKPKMGLNGEACIGADPEEVASLMRELGMGFCLDFGHALCAAYSLKRDEKEFLDAFLALKPELYHLSDGAKHTQLDSHSHLGAGSLDLPWLLSLVPKGGRVTLETGKNHAERLDDFIEDVRFAREAYGKAG